MHIGRSMQPKAASELLTEDEFITKDKRKVYIIFEEDMDSIASYNDQGRPIGEFIFFPQDDGHNEWHLLQNMFLDQQPGFQRQGIGEEMLRRYIENTGAVITAEDHTGLKSDSGAHLTGGGVGFVDRMREKGLIAPSASERYDRMDEPDLDK